MPKVSIIIVNWNSAAYLKKCLTSIYATMSITDVEIIVLDNASFDGSDELVALYFPDVIFIQLDQNLGFAGANNIGFDHAQSDYILFLNPDTELLNGAIDKMLEFLQSSPDTGAVGCTLLNSDLSFQSSCVQSFPTLLNQTFDMEFLVCLKLYLQGIHRGAGNLKMAHQIDVISGACLLVKSVVFHEVGLFSTEYFMFGEDVDLCYKIKHAGYKIYHVGQAIVIHHGGKSSEKQHRFITALEIRKSRMVFFRKTRGFAYAAAYQNMHVCVSSVRLVLILAAFPFAKLVKRDSRIKYALLKWMSILKWSVNYKELQAQ